MSYSDFVKLNAPTKPVFVYSDLHIATHHKCPRYCESVIEILRIATGHCDETLFLGDFFDRPNPTPYEIAMGAACIDLQSRGSVMVAGNHVKDRYDAADIVDVLLSIQGRADVLRPSQRTVIDSASAKYYVVPYNPDWVRDGSVLKRWLADNLDTEHDKANIVLLHGPLVGAQYDNGVVSKDGAVLDSDCFDGYDLVLAGDYHSPQRVKRFSTPFIYVGAPLQFNFSHRFEPVVRFMWIGGKTINIIAVPTNTLPLANGIVSRFFAVNLDSNIDALEEFAIANSESAWVRVDGTINESTNFALAQFRLEIDDRVRVIDARSRATSSSGAASRGVVEADGVSEYMDEVSAMSGSNLLNSAIAFHLESISDKRERALVEKAILSIGVQK